MKVDCWVNLILNNNLKMDIKLLKEISHFKELKLIRFFQTLNYHRKIFWTNQPNLLMLINQYYHQVNNNLIWIDKYRQISFKKMKNRNSSKCN